MIDKLDEETRLFVKKEFESLQVDLVAKYKELGMKASGKFERELEVTQEGSSTKLLGVDYTGALQSGRKPTTSNGKGDLIKAIKQWIIDKGIVPKDNISMSSLAFLITRKIHRDGWNRQGYGGVDLVGQVITQQRIQNIINKLGEKLAITLVPFFVNEFNSISK